MRESKNNKRKQSRAKIKETVIPLLSIIVEVIFKIWDLQFGILNIIIFTLIGIAFLILGIWKIVSFCKKLKKDEERYRCKKEKFIEEQEEYTDFKKLYSKIEKNEARYTKERWRKIIYFIVITTLYVVGIIVGFGMSIGQYNAMRVAKETVKAATDNNSSSIENITNIVNNEGSNNEITPEEKEEMKNKTIILSDIERLRVISKEDEEKVFYVSMEQEKLEEEVKAHINSIYNQRKKSAFLENSIEKEVVASAQKDEDIFLHARDEAEKYRTQGNYKGWKSVIPDSNTLEDIMSTRKLLLLNPSKEDMEFDGVVYVRLANNNQLLADEYRRQGGKSETVIYYYVEAIKMTEAGLAYEDIPREYKTEYYNYLKARYKDIADYIENNLEKFGVEKETYQELKEKANAIYKTM